MGPRRISWGFLGGYGEICWSILKKKKILGEKPYGVKVFQGGYFRNQYDPLENNFLLLMELKEFPQLEEAYFNR